MNTLSWIQGEIAKKLKSFQKVVIDLDGIFTVFRCQHHFLNSVVRWLVFARTDFWIGWVRHYICCLIFSFPARTVLYIKCSVDNRCLQPPFLLSFHWSEVLLEWLRSSQWTFHCFATGRWTVEHLYNERYFSEETWNTFFTELVTERLLQKTLLPANVKLSLDCCAVRARLRRQYLIPVNFGSLNSNILMSISWNQFFSESLVVWLDA